MSLKEKAFHGKRCNCGTQVDNVVLTSDVLLAVQKAKLKLCEIDYGRGTVSYICTTQNNTRYGRANSHVPREICRTCKYLDSVLGVGK